MSTPAVLPHRDAVVAALEGVGLVVGLGVAPDPVPDSGMYAVVHMSPGRSVSESLADVRSDFDGLMQVTAVGPDQERCLWVADKVRAALYGPLTVAGRVAYRPEELGGPPAVRDDDVSPPLWFVPIQFMIRSIS
ncbi:hypothetical protein U9R90_05130 [Streptomyces sp. E11-3]|uniref:hypothetical protein n=1 Tax=Streptomyces sp. E11-3 TaxID=3110112 RepID=UPI00397F6407